MRHAATREASATALALWAFAATLAVGAGAAAVIIRGGGEPAVGFAGTLVHGSLRLLPFLVFVPAAALVAVRLGAASWDGWQRGSVPSALRATLYLLLAGVAVTSVFGASRKLGGEDHLAGRVCVWLWTISGAGLLLAFAVSPRVLGRPNRRSVRVADVLLFNASLLLLCGEAVIAVASHVSSSPILHFDAFGGAHALDRRVVDSLARFRFKPGAQYFDKKLNSGGYVDDEFFVAGRRDFVVAVLADSFGVGGGVVPFEYNFATVAERRLQSALGSRFERVAVHNFGVAKIGLPEYFYLMLNEALPTNPRVVAVCIFVGNDIESGLIDRAETAGHALFRNWRVVKLPRRLWRLAVERRHGNRTILGTIDRFPTQVPAHVRDFRLEPPTFSKASFMQIERDRIVVCDALSPDVAERYEGVYQFLRKFKTLLRGRLLVVLIPDEFQVNDELWNELTAARRAGDALRRRLPQERIEQFCAANGIAVLDLLPSLFAAQRQEPAYHLRDTHWNARGHRVAGEAIADWIVKHAAGGATPGGGEPER